MKTSQEKNREPQKEVVQLAQEETSKGGEASFVDNRPATAVQRRLRMGIESTTGTTNPIQRKNNTGLPDNLKTGIENLSGYSMDDVKVHYNSNKPAQLQAHAYAQGTDIHLAPGQEKHLPHEAWHVVQQKQGRVQPTRQLKSKVPINDDAGLEKEADVMGKRAQSMDPNHKKPEKTAKKNANTDRNTIQRIFYGKRKKRGKREQSYYGPEIDPELIAEFKQFIQTVMDLLKRGNLLEATKLMVYRHRHEAASNVGVTVRPNDIQKDDLNEGVEFARKKNFFWPKTITVDIYIYPEQQESETAGFWGPEDQDIRIKKEIKRLLSQILFMGLEEYIHAYQHLTNSFWSASTVHYKGSSWGREKEKKFEEIKNESEFEYSKEYDYDEIDVMATYMDLGMDIGPRGIDYVGKAYKQRSDYKEWRKNRKGGFLNFNYLKDFVVNTFFE